MISRCSTAGPRRSHLLGFVTAVVLVIAACGSDGPGTGIRPRDGGGDDDAGDSGDNVPAATPVEDLSKDELAAICAPYKTDRDALLSTDEALESFYCKLVQFMSPDGGEPPTPPSSADECVAAQDECLAANEAVPPVLVTRFGLDCDGPTGVVERVAVYSGDATVDDLKECLAGQAAERERVLAMDCAAFIVSLAPTAFAASPACATLGLAD